MRRMKFRQTSGFWSSFRGWKCHLLFIHLSQTYVMTAHRVIRTLLKDATKNYRSSCTYFSVFFVHDRRFSTRQGTGKRSQNDSKVVQSAKEAISTCFSPGVSVNVGGFGLGGIPETLLNEVAIHPEAKELTVASLTAGIDGFGLGKLFEAGKIKRMIASYVGENKNFEKMFFGGQLEVELTPQGTIAARMQAAGAGIPAFFTPSGAGRLMFLRNPLLNDI